MLGIALGKCLPTSSSRTAQASSIAARKKGEAIRVSAEERSKFIDEFDLNLRRSKWIMYLGWALVLAGMIAFSQVRGYDLSQLPIFAGITLGVIPYLAYFRWVWAAPARELAGRTPVAGERPPDEVRRLQFQRITYRRLAGVAFMGIVIPFLGSSPQDVFSGWNRLWLVLGGAFMLLAAVQTFRKWRFEQEDSLRNAIPRSATRDIKASPQDATSGVMNQIWRYVPLAVLLLGLAFIAYTPAGKRLVQMPSFWPIVMIGIGGWAVITVARGFAKGRIEPLMRGIHNTYERETQPKRFWASMAWNSFIACVCLLGASSLWS